MKCTPCCKPRIVVSGGTRSTLALCVNTYLDKHAEFDLLVHCQCSNSDERGLGQERSEASPSHVCFVVPKVHNIEIHREVVAIVTAGNVIQVCMLKKIIAVSVAVLELG